MIHSYELVWTHRGKGFHINNLLKFHQVAIPPNLVVRKPLSFPCPYNIHIYLKPLEAGTFVFAFAPREMVSSSYRRRGCSVPDFGSYIECDRGYEVP